MSLCNEIKNMLKGVYTSYMINEYELECKDGKYLKRYKIENKGSKYNLDIIFFDKKDH